MENTKIQKNVKLVGLSEFAKKFLFQWQHEHVSKLIAYLTNNFAVLDGSDVGTGKTICALMTAKEMKLKPFIICPKSVIAVWENWAKKIGIEVAGIINYEMLRTGSTEFLKVLSKGKSAKEYRVEFNSKFLTINKTLIIFDEVHKCKNPKTQNIKMLIEAKNAGYKLLMLSGTVAETPLQLKGIGYALGLFNRLSDFYTWAAQNGCYMKDAFGSKILTFGNSPIAMKKLHSDIYENGKGSRLRVVDLKGLFPENQIVAETYTMSNADQIQSTYDEMQNELNNLKNKSKGDKESPLTLILRARQKIELLKVPTFVELVEDFIEDGCSVCIFVNFADTLKALIEKLSKYNPAQVHGGQIKEGDRDKEIECFQKNETRLIILNIQAGGVGISLHDLDGNFPRVTLISPTYSAIDLKQSLGRAYRAGGKSPVRQRIIYSAKTIEEKVLASVQRKIDNLDLLNDSDLIPENEIYGKK